MLADSSSTSYTEILECLGLLRVPQGALGLGLGDIGHGLDQEVLVR